MVGADLALTDQEEYLGQILNKNISWLKRGTTYKCPLSILGMFKINNMNVETRTEECTMVIFEYWNSDMLSLEQ